MSPSPSASRGRAGQCFPGPDAGDGSPDSAASFLSVTRCSRTEIPQIDNRMYRITAAEPLADPQTCPPGSDTYYWSFTDPRLALCAGTL
ncbi:hypothetical protein [Streptomyces phytophilus]|uniref:hypothetical protein n=1 Tax=Streptomyces phytophilus TaxID=722715 RepID=UPI0015EFFEA8|nr:hypothetical protein [Streptomyces phytophilus]